MTEETPKCPHCQSGEVELKEKYADIEWYQCTNCGKYFGRLPRRRPKKEEEKQ